MSVIDFHSHVLPGIDDGSRNSEESLGMLQLSASQGTDIMAATSHFYATEDRISSFLERRKRSKERLKNRIDQKLTDEESLPKLIVGLQVFLYTLCYRFANDIIRIHYNQKEGQDEVDPYCRLASGTNLFWL